ncbi:MAG: ATP-binding protein [Eubacteriaceae bacterium]|nr:ATP-binding protein [Eubacteriaceae bacterium]
MKKRLFLYITIIVSAGFICFFGMSVYVAHTSNLSIAKNTVIETANIYARLYSGSADLAEFVKTNADTRVTVVSSDGKVLADSRPVNIDSLDSHLSRPEIQAAANGAPETSIRYSETLGVDLIYYALKAESENGYVFIRTAFPVAKIDAYLSQALPLLVLSMLAVVFLCFLLIRSMTNRALAPLYSIEEKLRVLSKGEYKADPIASSYEEIDKITSEIDEIAYVLQGSIDALREEKTKLDYVMGNIGDGLFVVDEDSEIVLINSVALSIFGAAPDLSRKSLGYLTYDKAIVEKIKGCINDGEDALFEYAKNGRIFLTTVKRLPNTKLAMVVLSDVTENRENAKRREDFFANASHELKTPLTAIKGFNELMAINNKDDGINKYIDSISRETDRMLMLIGNMLKLSELENSEVTNPVDVSIAKTVNEAYDNLLPAITSKSIAFELVGDATVSAEPEHVYELVKNIIENAVRYNNQGGKVSVVIESSKSKASITVHDDGIGISQEEQSRVFERFYRIEKSRSVRNGGTGLGLAIVKHICALYDWQLSLKSKLGVGTEVKVQFYGK